MDRDFWLQRWEEGQIGFHQDQFNGYLTRHWAKLGAAPKDPVMVTLCGKSKDMLWLAQQGHKVTGVELSDLAVSAFFEENDIEYKQYDGDKFKVTEGDGITLLCGDFFDLSVQDMSGIGFVYDRASLIALPPEMRRRYAEHLKSLLNSGSKVLLVTMEYPQQEMNGPPFSVHHNEVDELYHDSFDIELLEEVDMLEANPQFKQRGLSSMIEKTYLMTRK